MNKSDQIRALRAKLVHATERLAEARIDHSLPEDIRDTKVGLIKKEIEILVGEIKKLWT